MSVFAVGSGEVPAHLTVLKLLVTVPPSPTFSYTWAFLETLVETVDKSYFCFPPQEWLAGHFNNAEILTGLFFMLRTNACLNLS